MTNGDYDQSEQPRFVPLPGVGYGLVVTPHIRAILDQGDSVIARIGTITVMIDRFNAEDEAVAERASRVLVSALWEELHDTDPAVAARAERQLERWK